MGFVKKIVDIGTSPARKIISNVVGDDGSEAAARAQQEAYEKQLQAEINKTQLESMNAANEVADVVSGGSAAVEDKSIANIKRKKIKDSISNSLGISS